MKVLKLSHLALSDLFNRLALLMHSGFTIGDGLSLLAEEEQDKNYAELLKNMSVQMDDGMTFAAVLEETKSFPATSVGMIRVAETVGNTEETLLSLGQYHRQRDRMFSAFRKALLYPAILLVVMFIVIILLLTKVLPIFDEVYRSLGSGITGLPYYLLSFGKTLNKALPYIEIVIALLVLAGAVIAMIPSAVNACKRFLIRHFGDRGVLRKLNNAQIAQALSVALTSGLPMEDAMDMAADLMANCPSAMKRCRTCLEMMESGKELTEALKETELFSPSACSMLIIGQRTGNIDLVMTQIAERMSDEAEDALEAQVMRIEPAVILFTSVLVGIILLSVMLPLIHIMRAI